MKPVAVIIFDRDASSPQTDLLSSLNNNPFIETVLVLSNGCVSYKNAFSVSSAFPAGGACLQNALDQARLCDCVLMIPSASTTALTPVDIRRFLEIAGEGRDSLYYADYYYGTREPSNIRRVCDYQAGSIRDDFFFGPVQLYSLKHIHQALERYGNLTDTRWAGLYELRLKTSLTGTVTHIPEPLSLMRNSEQKSHFSYVDPRQLDYQKEMELVATEHLKCIRAYCSHAPLPAPDDASSYPVEASIVIPVRNRERTVADAIRSALSQKTDFAFNVIVVQNHSTDRTAEMVDGIARHDSRVVHIVPERTDLGIGGCWNVAVQALHCGRCVCQLDSDDLYADEHTLAALVGMFHQGNYGMVVGSYRIVDFNLHEIPPGIIDHREWSDDNGRNNLLRVNGIGAPRAFPTALLRRFPFPNVSYGEDYAVSLRISRDYTVGRIYDPVYLCRRWEDNTDALLSNADEVRLASYKDSLRTHEILERQKLNTK